jgi:hypothetical protein
MLTVVADLLWLLLALWEDGCNCESCRRVDSDNHRLCCGALLPSHGAAAPGCSTNDSADSRMLLIRVA